MALPELDVAQVQRWCAVRVPEPARNQVRVECEVAPRHLTIVERRAPGASTSGSGGKPQCGQPTVPRHDSGGANYSRPSGASSS